MIRSLWSGDSGRKRSAIFLDYIANLLTRRKANNRLISEWISTWEIKKLQQKWDVKLMHPWKGILHRIPRANIIKVTGSKYIPKRDAVIPVGVDALIITGDDPYEWRYWITCQYGPCSQEEEAFFEDILQTKGWKKVERCPALQAQYFKIRTEEGTVIMWTEPSAPYNFKVGGKAECQEELNECSEDGDEVGAVVLRILQKSTERSAATNKRAVG